MADGGEGTLDALVEGLGGTLHEVRVPGPLMDIVRAPFGIVALEAMASGCLCVVADTGGQREVVPDDGTVGLRFPSRDSAALQEILEQRIAVTENGVSRRVRKLEVIIHRLVNDAVRGDPRAALGAFRRRPARREFRKTWWSTRAGATQGSRRAFRRR